MEKYWSTAWVMALARLADDECHSAAYDLIYLK